jgi:hypothetical protein
MSLLTLVLFVLLLVIVAGGDFLMGEPSAKRAAAWTRSCLF